MKNALFLVAGLSVFAIACSKDDDNEPEPDPTPAEIEMITSNTWKIDSLGYDTNNDGKMESALSLPSCGMDNTLSFQADSTGTFSEGADVCPNEPNTTPITWYFKDKNYNTIVMDGLTTELDGEVKVLALTDTSLVLSAPPGASGTLIVALGD